MNNASLELGGTNWAEKDGNILGYSVGDTSGKYSPQEFTFARGSNLSATRIDRAGLIVKGRENVLLQSNQFDTTWTNTRSTETSGQSGYDGTSDAWLLESTATATSAYLKQVISNSGVYTMSVYAKAGTSDWVSLLTAGSQSAYFDLANGVLGSATSNVVDSSIESIGNGWYRCSATLVDNNDFYVFIANGDGNLTTNSGDNILIQDAQLEQGLTRTDYIETTTTTGKAGVLENTPRLNYTTGVANPYLLLEPSRTNLVTQSEYFGDSSWVKLGNATGSVAIVTSNYAISPEGLQNASRLQCDLNGGNTTADQSLIYDLDSSNTSQCISIYIKSNNGQNQEVYLANTVGLNDTVIITSEWKRYVFSHSSSNHTFSLGSRGSTGSSDVLDILIWGAQSEAGSYPTSYIPTMGVSQTRAGDVCKKTGISSLIGQTEGTLYFEGSSDTIGGSTNLINFNFAANSVVINRQSTGAIRALISTSSAIVLNSSSVSGVFKVAIAYKNGDSVLYVNGALADSSTNSFTFATALTEVNLGTGVTYFALPNQSKCNQALVFKTRLSNADLATLTTI